MTTDRARRAAAGASQRGVMAVVVGLQVLGALFFSYDILGPTLGLRNAPLSWQMHELIEIGAAAGLAVGSVFGFMMLRRSDARRREAEDKLAALSQGFHELLEQRFAEWGLTPAEHDVAFFVMKGFTTLEIASLRNTSEGTVKAQTNAIYRKADVVGRAQLVSLFIEDLIDGEVLPEPLSIQ
jgi:DNA-binding CsgD family transcriptional regulator